MAHPTGNPASHSANAHSDWFMLLRSAFVDGLKAYGAALMMCAPEPALSLPKGPSQTGNWKTSTDLVGAPGPLHLGTGEGCTTEPKASAHERPTVKPKPSALPRTSPAKPAWSRA